MNTLDMIKDWKESGCKKKYIKKGSECRPVTAYNNGAGVLFRSYFVVTIGDDLEESEAFTINKENIDWEWYEIKQEYNIEQAFNKVEREEAFMVCLATNKQLRLNDTFKREEITGVWIELFKNDR